MDQPLDPNREVYPRAPLKLVACELVYTLAPGATAAASEQSVYEALAEAYPLPGVPPMGITIELAAAGSSPRSTAAPDGFRFLNRERTRSVVVTTQSLLLETSAYTRFEEFAQRISDAVRAVSGALRIAATHRIGLRYIDEIPLSKLPDGRWEPYFSAGMLAPARAVGEVGVPAEFLTTCRYDLGNDQQVTMRTGVLNAPVVSPDGPLSIAEPSSAPLALIDIDSAWQATTATTPVAFDDAAITPIIEALHAPVRALFENSITEALRDHLLRQENS